ncbi:eCIS core domain-containing protein [Denitromonas iodatirespirans]|uniref:DUF4157 domain-containing protein n=1 Tax=Denitromonas iodatirespirans TaxID=2795389 RepID=A0A944D7S4_DENI1|nr:DUF4157 domain-containing protein [Denitromonas iodatirespirans]MBT0959886.1 DUF4157 domain-containing protein [Denitromonas iodatirespirans]
MSALLAAIQTARPVSTTTSAPFLQRKCACGNTASSAEGECEACKRREAVGLQARLAIGASNDPLEHEADRAAAQVMRMGSADVAAAPDAVPRLSRRGSGAVDRQGAAPDSVQRTLGRGGEPLAPSLRAFFEPRFGHDFSRVRVHRDAAAAASAREVSAQAYTVGHHLVFATGRYAPESATGRGLLAHELAHVVQQSGALQRSAAAPEPETRTNRPDDEAPRMPEPMDEEADEADGAGGVGGFGGPISERFAAPIDSSLEGAPLPVGVERDAVEAERVCLATAAPDPAECDPARALTWADFSGAPRPRSRFGAMTHSRLAERAINTALARCAPYTRPNTRGVQAVFTPARSWVKPEFANAADPARNGCRRTVASCQAFFDREARAGRAGGTFGMSSAASRRCPASARARGDLATSRAECASVVATDCTDRATAESARLLAHEQGHFNLTCAMARKANTMLATAPNFDALLRAARTSLSRQQRRYDSQTRHGCNAGAQSAWETAIAGGLPAVVIQVPAGRGGRGRRRGR